MCVYFFPHLDDAKVAFGEDFSKDERLKSIIGGKDLRELLITIGEGVYKQLQFSRLQVLMLDLLIMHPELSYPVLLIVLPAIRGQIS